MIFNRPRKLPTGMTQFNAFKKRIFSKTGPIADETSMAFALASIVIHADAKHGALPDSYFVDRLIKSAANQVASQVFQDIKIQQAEEQKAAQEAANQPVEVTTTSEVVTNETPQV